MWLSKMASGSYEQAETAAVGSVTIGGGSAAVKTDCEYRGAAVYGPSGLLWTPKAGDEALVIKTASGAALTGTLTEPGELLPGEIMMFSDNCSVKLSPDGRIDLVGDVYVNGERIWS